MSETEKEDASKEPSLWLRLHAATGVVPLSLFFVEHVLVNASALWGGTAFDAWVGSLARSPLLPVVEIGFILVPLGYHALYGVAMTVRKDPPLRRYPGDPRKMLALQRGAGLVLFAFVAWHLWALRLRRFAQGLDAATIFTRLSEHLSTTSWGVPWIAMAYLVAVAAACTHFGSGLAAYWIDARAVRGKRARRRVVLAFAAASTLLFVVAAMTVISVATGARVSGADPVRPVTCGTDVPVPKPPPPLSSSH